MARQSTPIRVRGKCRRGHTLTTNTEPGRLTWRGPCPAKWGNGKCGYHLVCRRFDEQADGDAAAATQGATTDGQQEPTSGPQAAASQHGPGQGGAGGAGDDRFRVRRGSYAGPAAGPADAGDAQLGGQQPGPDGGTGPVAAGAGPRRGRGGTGPGGGAAASGGPGGGRPPTAAVPARAAAAGRRDAGSGGDVRDAAGGSAGPGRERARRRMGLRGSDDAGRLYGIVPAGSHGPEAAR